VDEPSTGERGAPDEPAAPAKGDTDTANYAATAKRFWDDDINDTASNDMMLVIANRVKDLMAKDADHEVAREYAKMAAESIDTQRIRIPGAVQQATRDAWTAVFSLPDNGGGSTVVRDVQTSLITAWMNTTCRLTEQWAADGDTSTDTRHLNMLRTLMDAMAEDGGNFARTSGSAEVMTAYATLNKHMYETVSGAKQNSPAQRASLVAIQQVWRNIDTAPAVHGDTPQKLEDSRQAEIARLRMYRHRVEASLAFALPGIDGSSTKTVDVSLLNQMDDHLFDGRSYKQLRQILLEFIRLSPEQKRLRKRLLQKHFEFQALRELNQRTHEMEEDAEVLAKIMRSGKPFTPPVIGDIFGRVENLEWACRRTWQHQFESMAGGAAAEAKAGRDQWMREAATDAKNVDGTPFETAAGDTAAAAGNTAAAAGDTAAAAGDTAAAAGNTAAAAGNTAAAAAAGNTAAAAPGMTRVSVMHGGEPEGVADGAADDVVEEIAGDVTAEIQQTVLLARATLRKMHRSLRAMLMKVSLDAVPLMGTNGLLVRDVVVPRIDAVIKALDQRVPKYATPIEPFMGGAEEDDAELSKEERSRQIENWRKTSVGSGDTVSFKMSDTTVSLMYALKGARMVSQVAALFVAQKAFAETYVRDTVVGGKDPPQLSRMLLLFLGIDATLQLGVLLVLVLLSYTHCRPDNAYAIDDEFIVTFLMEYFVTTTAVWIIGTLFAQIMRNKRYFEYPSQGRVVGRAYRDLMIGTCIVFGSVPFFLVL
jgi:hypothetical protein